MSESSKDKIEDDKHIGEIILSLMLAILGVIQGLSLNHLADKVPNMTCMSLDEALYYASKVSVCFVIVVRVFQTYFTAAIDKIPNEVDLFDVVSIFGVGLMEYWLINGIEVCDDSKYSILLRIFALAVAAVILHGKTTYRLHKKQIRVSSQIIRDELIQTEWINIPVALFIGVVAILGYLFRDSLNHVSNAILFSWIGCLLCLNIWRSLRDTRLNRSSAGNQPPALATSSDDKRT